MLQIRFHRDAPYLAREAVKSKAEHNQTNILLENLIRFQDNCLFRGSTLSLFSLVGDNKIQLEPFLYLTDKISKGAVHQMLVCMYSTDKPIHHSSEFPSQRTLSKLHITGVLHGCRHPTTLLKHLSKLKPRVDASLIVWHVRRSRLARQESIACKITDDSRSLRSRMLSDVS